MVRPWRILWVTVIILTSFAVSTLGVSAQTRHFLGLSTAPAGGAWHPIGLALGTTWTTALRDSGISVSAQTSSGAVENLEMMRTLEIELALNFNEAAVPAWNGTGQFAGKEFRGFRTVASLFAAVPHVVLRADLVSTGHLSDADGTRFSLGPAGSSTLARNRLLLKLLGIEVSEQTLGFGAAASAIKDGRIDGGDLGGSAPHPSVIDLVASGVDFRLLSVTQADVDAINAELGEIFYLGEIPGGTYVGHDEPAYALAQATYLIARGDLDAEIVYRLTETLWQNVDSLALTSPLLTELRFENALRGLTLPLHPGAYRYYVENGLHVPDRLIPPELR